MRKITIAVLICVGVVGLFVWRSHEDSQRAERAIQAQIAAEKKKTDIIESARQGDSSSQHLLADMYRSGDGVEQSDAKAVELYRMAALQGDIISQVALGELYRIGNVIPRDLVAAHAWYTIAHFENYSGAKTRDEELYIFTFGGYSDESLLIGKNLIAGLLSAEELEQSRALVRKCLDSDYKDCF